MRFMTAGQEESLHLQTGPQLEDWGPPEKNIDAAPPPTHTCYILYNIQAWNQIACFFCGFHNISVIQLIKY